ncbi:MAG: cupin domain-containing protein [Anaerolineales bacterium]|jgi:glucose-6-phosphate isomerase|nr:cupin domain-containing protein [Anaerolineales bacterium]
MKQHPFTFSISVPDETMSEYDNHIVRRLSAMVGQYQDAQAFTAMLSQDPVLYEVYEIKRPESEGELMNGISIVHPGKVGEEYFMTKGHFHTVLDTAEVYYCLKGEGMMVMETPEGEWSIEELHPGCVLYVPPRWAHRSVNTGQLVNLVTFFIYPGNAGHDYGTIEQQGFRKLVVERDGRVQVIDNPRWHPKER